MAEAGPASASLSAPGGTVLLLLLPGSWSAPSLVGSLAGCSPSGSAGLRMAGTQDGMDDLRRS